MLIGTRKLITSSKYPKEVMLIPRRGYPVCGTKLKKGNSNQLILQVYQLYDQTDHLLFEYIIAVIIAIHSTVKKITTRTATIYMDENRVLHIQMLDKVRVDYEDAMDNLLVVKSCTKGKKALKLIDARAFFRVEKRARELINSVDAKQTIARAVVKGSIFTRVLLSFYTGLNKPTIPTKIFSDYDEAYNWLLIQGIRYSELLDRD
ncbi:MAG: hypothetical protein Q8L81_08905 [Bacteroidota bacterium]|nr:hypothetical protein [Bacteroidota bacterium]